MKYLMIAALQLFALQGVSQDYTYESKVLDVDQQPIPYAAVFEVGTQNYTTTDEKGTFKLNASSKNFTLQISSIGYETLNVEVVNGQLPGTLLLNTSQEQLDEVVVTALTPGPDNFNNNQYPTRYLYPESEQAANKTHYDDAVMRMGGDNINVKNWWEK